MTRVPLVTGCSVLCAVTCLLAAPVAAQTTGQPVVGLVQGTNSVIQFNTSTPGTVSAQTLISGLTTGDTLKAIDYRPATGVLYGLATNGSNTVGRLYTINLTTGVATMVGAPQTAAGPAALWDINFNPVVDRIRVVNDQGENARLVPDSGALAANDTNLTPPTVVIDAVAYTNPVAGATTTTLYALNQTTNSLATIGGVGGTPSPNGGTVIEVGPLGVTFAGSPTSLDIATNGTAFAVLRPVSGALALFTINLTTGTATLVGAVGDGTLVFDDIAIVDPGLTVSPPTGTYTSRQSFDLALLADAPGRTVISGTATFNGMDVTSFLGRCLRPGIGAGGITSFRCPALGGPVVGPGTHTLQVRLMMNDGTQVQRAVTWTVVPIIEP
jgi:hypothetical protein